MTIIARDTAPGALVETSDTGALVDVDTRPDLALELDARVERDRLHGLVIIPANPARWRAALGRMVDRRITVTLSREKERRSLAANAFLWAMYTRLVEEMRAKGQDEGWASPFRTTQDAHDWAKFRFLGVEVVSAGPVEIERPSTTTRLTPAQFHRFTESIKAVAARDWQIDLGD